MQIYVYKKCTVSSHLTLSLKKRKENNTTCHLECKICKQRTSRTLKISISVFIYHEKLVENTH